MPMASQDASSAALSSRRAHQATGFHQKAEQARHSIQRTRWSRLRTCASSCASTDRSSCRSRLARRNEGITRRTLPPVQHTIGDTRAVVVCTSGNRARSRRRPISRTSRRSSGGAGCEVRASQRLKRRARASVHPSSRAVPASHPIASPALPFSAIQARKGAPSAPWSWPVTPTGTRTASLPTSAAPSEITAATALSPGSTGSDTTAGRSRATSTSNQSGWVIAGCATRRCTTHATPARTTETNSLLAPI